MKKKKIRRKPQVIVDGRREAIPSSAQSLDSTRRQNGVLSNGAGSAEGSRCGANVCVGVEGVYEHNK